MSVRDEGGLYPVIWAAPAETVAGRRTRGIADKEAEPIYTTKNGEGNLVVMSIEALELQEEALKPRTKLGAAEQARPSGAPTYTLEESRKRFEAIYQRG